MFLMHVLIWSSKCKTHGGASDFFVSNLWLFFLNGSYPDRFFKSKNNVMRWQINFSRIHQKDLYYIVEVFSLAVTVVSSEGCNGEMKRALHLRILARVLFIYIYRYMSRKNMWSRYYIHTVHPAC